MERSTSTSNMITLNSSIDYEVWKPRMEDLLYAKGFHQPVFSAKKPANVKTEEWDLFHRQVCRFIRQWIGEDGLKYVDDEVNARTLWSKLGEIYDVRSGSGKFVLMKQLMGLKYEDGNVMSDHLDDFRRIINQFLVSGIVFDDELLGLSLLASLPDTWEAFRSLLLKSTPKGVVSLEFAINGILKEEKKRKALGSVSGSPSLFDEGRVRKRQDEESDNGGANMQNKRFCSQRKMEEQRRRDEAELYTTIRVSRDENLREQIGTSIYFDLVDHLKVHSFRIRNDTSFALFQEEVAKELGIPVQYQRFWLWVHRENKTYRPHCPLSPLQASQSVGQLRGTSKKAKNAELNLFLEIEVGAHSRPIPPPVKTKEDILLFFKLYDPLRAQLRYVGRFFVKVTGKPSEILMKLNELAGFAPDEDIVLFEEIRSEPSAMCVYVDKNLTFRASLLEDGDIICFQKRLQFKTITCHYPDVPSFLKYLCTPQVVHFRALELPSEDEFVLELSKLNNYDDVVKKVASHLCVYDPSKIRLTSHNCYHQQPKSEAIKYRGVENLLDMLTHYNQVSDILYYEILDIPLPEVQNLKSLEIYFHHATKDEVVLHNIKLPKHRTVGGWLNYLKTKVELSHEDAELRLLEVFNHKIYRISPLNEIIEKMNDQNRTLRAEEIPEEQKELGPQNRLIHVYHFKRRIENQRYEIQNFGDPFFFVIREGETLAALKVRMQKKLQVSNVEFSKWKFAYVVMGRPVYLQDSDVVSACCKRKDSYRDWEQYLGLEHHDSTSQ